MDFFMKILHVGKEDHFLMKFWLLDGVSFRV